MPVPGLRPRLLCAVVSASLIFAPGAMAATRHVAPGAGDAGDCVAVACGSLGYAYGQSAGGDAIELAGGSYGAQTLPAGAKAVTVRAAPGATPDLAGLSSSLSNATVQGLKLRQLSIAGGTSTVYERLDVDARFEQHVALDQAGGSDITIRDSRVGNVTDEKGAIVGDNRVTFDRVTFHDVRVTAPDVHNECVYATGAEGLTVRNSHFYACATMDLFFTNFAGGPAYGNITLENNVFEHSTMEEPGSWHYFSVLVHPVVGALRNWTVRNNTFEIPFTSSGLSGSGRWVGNLGGWDCVGGLAYSHNVGDPCASSDRRVAPSSSTATRTAAFGWQDAVNHDFHLKAGSQAIGAADPADAPATDADGYARDARPDAGAYEFGAGPASGGGAPATPAPSSKAGTAPRISSARLTTHAICRHRRRGCPTSAGLRLTLSAPGRVSVRVERLRTGRAPHRARSFALTVRSRRTTRIRARGLRAGRFRVVVTATDAAGRSSNPRRLALRVR